jgi:hypothetical protein
MLMTSFRDLCMARSRYATTINATVSLIQKDDSNLMEGIKI